MPEDDYLPISYLNDFLFCERRAALHLLEGIWIDNQYTMEGTYAHRRVDIEGNLKKGKKRDVTGMWVVSHRLRLIGRCDLVEMREVVVDAGQRSTSGGCRVRYQLYPVDYKRGKKRRWDNDEVQLCAQALCLEEMLGVSIPLGAIYHIKSQQRQEVVFDDPLRGKTELAAQSLFELLESRRTPRAPYHAKCRGCSLFEWCMPRAQRVRMTASRYVERLRKGEL